MTGYFGYVPVSSVRQGEGVSLIEQRSAIERYALAHHLPISEWFTETETAAKRGRKVFREVLSRLGKRQAQGLIIHKIDRGARNLGNWADLGELVDKDIDVSFARLGLFALDIC